jgi:hypothetical protein
MIWLECVVSDMDRDFTSGQHGRRELNPRAAPQWRRARDRMRPSTCGLRLGRFSMNSYAKDSVGRAVGQCHSPKSETYG